MSDEKLSLDGPSADLAAPFSLVLASGESVQVTRGQAMLSKLVSNALASDESATQLRVDGVSNIAALNKVKDYMEHHDGKASTIPEKPLRSKSMSDVCADKWDATFIDGVDNDGNSRQLLYDVVLAANYLDIQCLLHIGCAKVASLIKGQPLEKIKDILAKGTSTKQ
jgi:S-phase kinase-associated protein 1